LDLKVRTPGGLDAINEYILINKYIIGPKGQDPRGSRRYQCIYIIFNEYIIGPKGQDPRGSRRYQYICNKYIYYMDTINVFVTNILIAFENVCLIHTLTVSKNVCLIHTTLVNDYNHKLLH
jgi:hypothetical protein